MNIIILKKIVFLIPGLFLVSCSQKNIEIDLSNLPKPKITNTVKKENKQSINLLDKEYISDLAPLKDREKILSNEFDLSKRIRIGGLVKENSILKEGKKISFKIHDGIDEILVIYNGILPDLFREEQGVVALGKIENKNFSAIEILAKHDENYMPKEVSDMLKKNGKWKGKLN